MRGLAIAAAAALALSACQTLGGALPCTLALSYDPTNGAIVQSCTYLPDRPLDPAGVTPTEAPG